MVTGASQLTATSMMTCALVLSMDLLSRFHVHTMDCGQVEGHKMTSTAVIKYLMRAPVLVIMAAKTVWHLIKEHHNKHILMNLKEH